MEYNTASSPLRTPLPTLEPLIASIVRLLYNYQVICDILYSCSTNPPVMIFRHAGLGF